MRSILWTCCLTLAAAACSAPPVEREPVAPQLVDDTPEKKSYSILRSDYEETVQEGLQSVLRWYFTKPAYSNDKKFVGYRIMEIYKLELMEGPLVSGDVIVSVNDLPVERPEQAMKVWRGLWGRKSLKLTFIRNNKVINLNIPIVDKIEQKDGEQH